MKKTLLVLSILALTISNAAAQKTDSVFPVKGVPIKVLRWGSLASYMIPKFWLANEKAIAMQIGKDETKDFKQFCSTITDQLPKALQDRYAKDSAMFPQQAFEKLNIYMIGSFINRFNKKNMTKKAILRIPFRENMGVVEEAVWEGNLYFMIDYANIKKRN